MKKYGNENFEFIILEYVLPDKELLIMYEQKWLDFYKNNNKWDKLYNLCPFAETNLGLKATEEARKNISNALKGKKKSPEQIEKMRQNMKGKTYQNKHLIQATEKRKRKIIQINKETDEVIKIYGSLREAALAINAKTSAGINQVALGNLATAHGYKWRYVDNPSKEKKITNVKKVIMYSIEGEEIKRFKSIREAGRFFNCKNAASTISRVLKRNKNVAYGYKWKYVEE